MNISNIIEVEMDKITEDDLDSLEAKMRDVGARAFRAGDDAMAGKARDGVAIIRDMRSHLKGQTSVESPSGPVSPQLEKAQPGTRRNNYPHFEVRHNSLIRIGWSKKRKAEYQVKTPCEIFNRTVEAMRKVAHSGRGPFVAEDIIEKTKNGDGPVPSYQAYAVISLLCDRKYVEKVGRGSYMIPEDISSQAMRAWQQLEEETK